jgi:DNA-binding CsgD family transcriptional regulator
VLAAAFATLTPRECEALLWIVRSKRDAEIAVIPGIHATTASTHVRNLLGRLRVESRHAAAMEVVRVIVCE